MKAAETTHMSPFAYAAQVKDPLNPFARYEVTFA